MRSLDLLSWHVMDAMAHDWESIAQIRPHVHQYHEATSDERIFQILRQLHENELIKIMDEDGYGTSAFPSDPSECWFCMSDTGKALWQSEGSKYEDEHEKA
jgi:hypothetical protein